MDRSVCGPSPDAHRFVSSLINFSTGIQMNWQDDDMNVIRTAAQNKFVFNNRRCCDQYKNDEPLLTKESF